MNGKPSNYAMSQQVPPTPAPPSFGPGGQFRFTKSWGLGKNDRPEYLDNHRWDMWIVGAVTYKDEFTDDVHFTSFSFTQGEKIDATHWEMYYTAWGNESDRPKDRRLKDASEYWQGLPKGPYEPPPPLPPPRELPAPLPDTNVEDLFKD